jgi:hypothetical protein
MIDSTPRPIVTRLYGTPDHDSSLSIALPSRMHHPYLAVQLGNPLPGLETL